MSEYFVNICIQISIYLILAQALNLTFGKARLLNFAHIASYALGAYATALLSTKMGFNVFQCLAVSALISGLLAVLIGAVSLRLEHDYFLIGTLAFAAIVQSLIINWKGLTRGTLGITGIPRPEILGIDFYNNTNFLLLSCFLAVLALLLLYLVFNSSFGRALSAQAEFEQAALAIGINSGLQKNFSFMISSALAGIAGSIFAYYVNFIDPSSFSLTEMVFVLTLVIAGKPGSFWGVLVASIFLVILPEPLRFLNLDPSILGPLRQLLYSVILFLIVWINRERLFPIERQV